MTVTSVEGHVIIDSEEDIIFKSNGVERARIDENGNFSGFSTSGAVVITPATLIATFSQSGTLTRGTGVSRFRMPAAGTITGVVISVGTAPTGAAIICDLNKNGTTVFTTQGNRPSISASGFVSTVQVPDVTAFLAGDYFVPDIDQTGSGVAGSDLTLQLIYTLSS